MRGGCREEIGYQSPGPHRNWVAVMEIGGSYYIGEIILTTKYPF